MTLTVKLKLEDDIRRVRLGSSDPYGEQPNYSDIVGASKELFGISASNIDFKYLSKSNNLVPMQSDMQFEEAITAAAQCDRLPQFIVSDPHSISTAPAPSNLHHSCNCSPFSSSAPSSPSLLLQDPKLGSSVPSQFTPLSSSTSTPPPSLIKRFYDLVKYVNVPDVLRGLENFGYLSSDQSIELFQCLLQLRKDFPELAKVLQYEVDEEPICTVKHIGITCDACLTTDFSGTRYKCAICPNFDMCEKCERKGLLTHGILLLVLSPVIALVKLIFDTTLYITHPRIKMLVPSDCTFEHACKSYNAQGEKCDSECTFSLSSKMPKSPSILVATPTYEKRQLQFTTLLKKKQLRDTMRKMHIQEVERVRQEEEQQRAAEALLREQEEEKRRQKEKEQRQAMRQSGGLRQSGGMKQSGEQGKSIVWGYFENLKKQNKYQNISANLANSAQPNSEIAEPHLDNAMQPRESLIAISGHLDASSSSVTSATPASLSNSTASTTPLSPPLIHVSSSSSSSSPSLSRAPSSSMLSAPSSMISSRLQKSKSFVPESPECSPMFPSPALGKGLGSPISRRESNLKQSATIQRGKEDEIQFDPEVPELEVKRPKKGSEETKSKRDLSGVLRDMGLRFSSDSDTDSDDDDYSDSGYETSSPKKKNEPSFFSSLRDLLK